MNKVICTKLKVVVVYVLLICMTKSAYAHKFPIISKKTNRHICRHQLSKQGMVSWKSVVYFNIGPLTEIISVITKI